MAGRGRARNVRVQRNANQDAEREQAPQYLIDLLAPLTERLRALEDAYAGRGQAIPTPDPEIPLGATPTSETLPVMTPIT